MILTLEGTITRSSLPKDAIVVLQSIERQMARSLERRTATLKAMEEITGPVIAIALVLSAVIIPCCFLGGVSGPFFRSHAVKNFGPDPTRPHVAGTCGRVG